MKRRIISMIMVIVTMMGVFGTTSVGAAEFKTDKFEKFLCLHACYCGSNLSTKPINNDVCDIICSNHGKVATIDLNEYRQNGWCTHDFVEDFDTFCPDCKQAFTYNGVKDNTYDNSSVSTETVCLHKNIVEYMASGNVYGDKNGCYEQGLFIFYCDDCQQELTETTYKEKVYEHDFTNNVCCKCGYSGTEELEQDEVCSHKNTNTSFSGNTYNTETSHVEEGYFITYCLDCEKELTEPILDKKETTHSFSADGICKTCGYEKKIETRRTAWVYGTSGVGLRLRSDASVNSDKILTIPEGSEVVTVGDAYLNGFIKTEYNGKTGFSHKDYLTYTKPVSNTTTVSSNYTLPFNGNARITVLDYYYGKKSKGAHATYGSGNVLGAIDFAAVTGNALSVANATVADTKSGWNSGWGNWVLLRLNDGNYAFYAHLSTINVKKNQQVTAGQAVGVIGSTGNSTGTHLHFELLNSAKQTIYGITYFKQYKSRLRFDADIASGDDNSALQSWIRDNYYLQNGVYYPNSNPVVSTTSTTTTASSTQQISSSSNTKASFVNANLTAWKNALDAKAEAAELVYEVTNSIKIRQGLQKILGSGVVAAWTISPSVLYKSFDEDTIIGLVSFGLTTNYLNAAESNHVAFNTKIKNGIHSEEDAEAIFRLFKESLACYNAAIESNIDMAKEYSISGNYTKRMLDTFFTSLVDAAVPDIDKLKKICNATMTTSELLQTVESNWNGRSSYKNTVNEWDSIWAKVK